MPNPESWLQPEDQAHMDRTLQVLFHEGIIDSYLAFQADRIKTLESDRHNSVEDEEDNRGQLYGAIMIAGSESPLTPVVARFTEDCDVYCLAKIDTDTGQEIVAQLPDKDFDLSAVMEVCLKTKDGVKNLILPAEQTKTVVELADYLYDKGIKPVLYDYLPRD